MELIDLRTSRDDGLLEAVYRDLYRPHFRIPEQQEDPEVWRPLLWGGAAPPQPELHILVAGRHLRRRRRRALMGFVAVEWYAHSHAGFVTYLAVHPSFRRQGLARRLLEAARQVVVERDPCLRALFGEVNDPQRTSLSTEAMDPRERLGVYGRLGARRIPIAYVQPPLRRGQERLRSMFLVVFPLHSGERSIPRQAVQAFLHEFYQACDVNPDEDVDFRRMLEHLPQDLPLEPIAPGADGSEPPESRVVVEHEESLLTVSRYGVAVHVILDGQRLSHLRTGPGDLASFERDLLSYAYKDAPPFRTELIENLPRGLNRVQVRFPRDLRFVSEGGLVTSRAHHGEEPFRHRTVQVRAGITSFREGGRDVFHLVLSPPRGAGADSHLNEFDLIKLAKLWQRGALAETFVPWEDDPCVRFLVGGRPLRWYEVLREAIGVEIDLQAPRVGTIQVILSGEWRMGNASWSSILAAARALSENRVTDSVRRVEPEVQRLAAVITGLLDVENVGDLHELVDVFRQASVWGADELDAVHKGTLLGISGPDRAYDAVQDSIGISPYLLIPHAVLLHNEHCLLAAREAAGWLSSPDRLPGPAADLRERAREAGPAWRSTVSRRLGGALRDLEHVRSRMQEALDRHYLPNVFHYQGEREVYEQGEHSWGLRDLREELRHRLAEIGAIADSEREWWRRLVEAVIATLLFFISVVQVDPLLRGRLPPAATYAILAGVVGIGSAFLYFTLQGRPRLRGPGDDRR